MRWFHWIFVCLWLTAAPLQAQHSEDWLPVSSAERQFKEVPGDPGAVAVQLYYADFRDDLRQHQFIYHRIKVLKPGGERYANVQIDVPLHFTATGIQARTIHPDGRIVPFTGKPYDRLLRRQKDERLIAKTFTLPDVTVGSILEYKYDLGWEKYLPDAVWKVQHDLYTVKESFSLRSYSGPLRTRHVADQTQLAYVYSNLPAGVVPKNNGAVVELKAEGVPAFQAEPYMPPEENFRSEVRFFYGGREIESPESFWADLDRQWFADAERFIGSHEEIKAAAAQIAGGESDPHAVLKKLYLRVQELRNLSFERERTKQEDKKEELKANDSVVDVLSRGYGYQNEITELLVALARAAGFDAVLLRVSSRRSHVFNSRLLSEGQLPAEIAGVTVNGTQLYLDPGSRFCPFGMVTWEYTSSPALQLDKAGGHFVIIPTAPADKNVVRRTADLSLNTDGSAQGGLTVEFKGNDALEHRLSALEMDDAGRRRALEDEIQDWLPKGSMAQLEGFAGWEASEEPLIARFSIAVPRFALAAGRRWLLPGSLFQSRLGLFSPAERRYPVYFPYTYEEIDKLSLQLPLAHFVEMLPDGQDVKLPSARFLTTRSAQGGELVETRALVVNSIYFEPEDYTSLKGFFNALKAADEEQVVVGKR